MKSIIISIAGLLIWTGCFAANDAVKNVPAVTSAGNILNVILGLVVVLAIIYVLAFGLKRFGTLPGRSGHSIRVISGINLSQRDKVILIQVGEEQLLLGVSPGRINLLHNLPKLITEEQNISHPQESSFASRLSGVLRGNMK